MLLTRARLTAAGLLLASTVAFATGITVESQAHSEAAQPQPSSTTTAPSHDDSDADSAARSAEGPAVTSEHNEGSSESLLGVNTESTGLVITGVVISLLLAAGLLLVRAPLFAAGTGLAMLAFTALDISEIVHQLGQSHTAPLC